MDRRPYTVMTQLYEAFNSGDEQRLRELISPDVVAHLPGTASDDQYPPGKPRDREGWLQSWKYTLSFFPDMNATVEDIVETGDMVATRCTTRGTHSQSFMGIPPTGRSFEMLMLNMTRIQDGVITEHWTISDNVTMMAQLGLAMPR
jgi:predicted ester cyclase